MVLAEYTYPLQVIWGRKKLTSLDDIKGMKLRVAQPEQGEMVRRFGGTSVTISAPEVPSALIGAWSTASIRPASAPCCGRIC